MRDLATFTLIAWLANIGLQILLVILLLANRSWRTYTAFLCYLLGNLLQAFLLYLTYSHFGFASLFAKRIYWLTQVPITLARGWIIVELWRQILARYSGIWALAWRGLCILTGVLLMASVVFAGFDWRSAVVRADHAISLTMVVLLVVLFVFARLYGVAVSLAVRFLSTGFVLYLGFGVLNDKILEHFLGRFASLWTVLSLLSFLASALLWVWAFRKPLEQPAKDIDFLPHETYYAITPELNRRLRLLNERLSRVRAPLGNRL
jgi:hypothetical protein